ncbi:MAG: glycosyltransferase [Bacteroidota bacterium]
MKILLLGPAYPLRGGVAHFNGLLYQYLSRHHNVEIISYKRQYPKIFFPGTTQEETGGIPVPALSIIDSINPLNWLRVGMTMRSKNADVIIVAYWMSFFAPCLSVICSIIRWKKNTAIICLAHNIIPHERKIWDNILSRLFFSVVDSFVVLSESVERDLLSLIKKPTYVRSFHPVYESFGTGIPKEEAKKHLSINEERVILFFGYIRRYKGLHILIDALKIVRQSLPVQLLVVGEFYEDEQRFRKQIAENELESSVNIYPEYVSNEQVKYFFSASDVVIIPYLSATQSGIVQIAYNFNKPVIATNVGGLAETVIHEKSGLIVPADDAEQLAGAIKKFYTEHLEAQLTEGTLHQKKNFSWDAIVRDIEKLINK